MKEYGWLAVSKVEGREGAWCTFCSVFQSSECGGGRVGLGGIGGNQKMGALVNTPLRNFKKLSGKDGVLSTHQNIQFHKTCQLRACEFKLRVAGNGPHPHDIRKVIDASRQREAE